MVAIAVRISGWIVAAMLLMSAFAHLDNGFAFLSSVLSYRLLDRNTALFAAAFVPPLQLVLAFCLCFSVPLQRQAFGWCVGLFAVFIIAQTTTIYRGLNVACGCFGSSSEANPIGWQSLSTAGAGLFLSLIGLYFTRSRFRTLGDAT